MCRVQTLMIGFKIINAKEFTRENIIGVADDALGQGLLDVASSGQTGFSRQKRVDRDALADLDAVHFQDGQRAERERCGKSHGVVLVGAEFMLNSVKAFLSL